MQIPLYIRISILVLGLYFFTSALYYLENFIVPIAFGGFLATLMLPVCSFLERRKIPRVLAIIICVSLLIFLIALLILLFYSQVLVFMDDLPLFKDKLLEKFQFFEMYIQRSFNISMDQQMHWIKLNYSRIADEGTGMLKSIIVGFSGGMVELMLVVVYFFLFMLMREKFFNFALALSDSSEHAKVTSVFFKIKNLTIHYLSGLMIVILITGTLNAAGFYFLGIEHAIFLGYLRGALIVIPYIGPIIGTVFPLISAIVFKDSLYYSLGVLIVSLVVQFIENNYLTPKIVGSHIRINPLFTIVAIILGGLLWGVSGMVLFLPLLGIVKIICDNVESLKPLGELLGENNKKT